MSTRRPRGLGLAPAREALDEAAFAAEIAAGRSLSLDEAIELL